MMHHTVTLAPNPNVVPSSPNADSKLPWELANTLLPVHEPSCAPDTFGLLCCGLPALRKPRPAPATCRDPVTPYERVSVANAVALVISKIKNRDTRAQVIRYFASIAGDKARKSVAENAIRAIANCDSMQGEKSTNKWINIFKCLVDLNAVQQESFIDIAKLIITKKMNDNEHKVISASIKCGVVCGRLSTVGKEIIVQVLSSATIDDLVKTGFVRLITKTSDTVLNIAKQLMITQENNPHDWSKAICTCSRVNAAEYNTG